MLGIRYFKLPQKAWLKFRVCVTSTWKGRKV